MRASVPPLAAAALAAGACSYTSYTPPARMMPLETAIAPTAAQTDVQLEASGLGAVMGFGTTNGGVRVRQGVNDNVSVAADAGVLSVEGHTARPTETNAYLARVGVHVHQADREAGPHIAMTAGVGGGASALAGRWVSEDVGVIVSGNGAWLVPFAALEGFASQPIDAQPFSYYASDEGDPHSDVLTRTAGYRVTFGLELRDGTGANSSWGIIAGLMLGGVAKPGDDDFVGGFGAGARVSF